MQRREARWRPLEHRRRAGREPLRHVLRRGAGGGRLVEAPGHDHVQLRFDSVSDVRELRRILTQVRDHECPRCLTREWPLPRQQLEREQPERVDVGLGPDVVAGELFGAHVPWRPDDHACLREARVGREIHRGVERGDAPIGDQGPSGLGVEEDIRRLDVAVDHATRVRSLKRRSHLPDRALGLGDRKRALLLEAVGEAAALDVVHHEVWGPVFQLPDGVDGDHIGMGQSCNDLSFAEEPRPGLVVGNHLGAKHLHSEGSPQIRVPRQVDLAHTSEARHVQDLKRNQLRLQ